MSLFSTIGSPDILGGASSGVTKPTNKDAPSSSFGAELSAVDKFLKYQEMTPAQKIRASYLAAHGLTEEDVAAMSPEDRKKIEDQIIDEIKRKAGVTEIRQG